EYLRQWLSTYAKPNTAPKTFSRYEQLVRVHLLPALGAIPLTKLRPLHVQDAYHGILEKGLSARTALQCHRVLREALQHAVKWHLLTHNPADAVEAPRAPRYEIPALASEQVQRVLAAADETAYGTLVHTALLTGLRLGELLGLRWQDVDLEAGTLQVRQTCQWLPRQGFIFRQPKSHNSIRSVSLSRATVERLRQHRVEQIEERLAAGMAHGPDRLVFANPVGQPVHPSSLRQAWKRLAQAAGLRHLRFHDLRHAHASLLLQQGVHPKIVSERLGHSGVHITLDTYSHVLPSLQAEAAKRLDDLLANG
ncbi:MAG: tyrosine-type recombinase/integrase, partial [Anaerolineae bacterium]|nr:tyrosine-type recombinase/integrase [Anaerolineae bacterium]NIN97695.1 tyrosine-type recombinase/integrase [Anaerolineae bacterium]NIQ80676.1 tyrosine-type recombinase/integrase [Anaerolineae bacterium]